MNGHGRRQSPGGCLGRMVNLFDFATVASPKKLLSHKPHSHDGSTKRNPFDPNQIQDKVGVNGTPMKKLLAQEMSKEMELNVSTNLVAKLMGLDSFPPTQTNSSMPRLRRSMSHGEYKDVYEINGVEGLSKKKMDTVREKFLEAKRLVTDDKLRHSKEFRGAMEVLSSNKELFLEFLQESNNFFSHHLHSSTAPQTPEKSTRITILKPSKSVDSSREKSLVDLFDWQAEEECQAKQPSRIVVLKPNCNVVKASSCPTSPRGLDFEERDVARRSKRQETLHSSVLSNGYIGDCDDNKSENNYADSEIMSPVSWDYINKYDSTFSPSPFSRASRSPESSSVCREAKKRLSERWALISASSNETLHEAKTIEKKGSTSTLGEMLALSDLMEDLRTDHGSENEDPRGSGSCLGGDFTTDQSNLNPLKSLTRSRSLPETSTRSPDTNKGISKVPEVLTKSKSLKWSLKGKVSSFLFLRNKKTTKEKSHEASQVVDHDSREEGLSIASSVFETSLHEDDGILETTEPESMTSMRSNLLGKSPPIGSLGRSFSFDDSTIARCYSSKRSITCTRDEEEEEDLRLLINTLLSAADLNEVSSSSSVSKWYSAESPLDPSLRNSYADSTEQQRLLGSHLKKLVFDLVNTLLLELTPSYLGARTTAVLCGKSLQGYVVERIKGNRRVEDRWWDEDGDLSSLAVNQVVRMEVAEIGSPESLRLEMDSIGEELELKLLEELVEETLMDLSKLFSSSIC